MLLLNTTTNRFIFSHIFLQHQAVTEQYRNSKGKNTESIVLLHNSDEVYTYLVFVWHIIPVRK